MWALDRWLCGLAKGSFFGRKKVNLDGLDHWKTWMWKNEKTRSNQPPWCGRNIMVWGMLFPSGKIFVNFLTSTVYQPFLQICDLPIIYDMIGDDFIFQQDNCSVHVSESSQKLLEERRISLLNWRARPGPGPLPKNRFVLEKRVEEAVLDKNLQGCEKLLKMCCWMPHRIALALKKSGNKILLLTIFAKKRKGFEKIWARMRRWFKVVWKPLSRTVQRCPHVRTKQHKNQRSTAVLNSTWCKTSFSTI